MLIVELPSIRQPAFDDQTGNVTDLGSAVFGDGAREIFAAIGITPWRQRDPYPQRVRVSGRAPWHRYGLHHS